MKKLNIAFFGAPIFAAEVLQNIIEDKELPIDVRFVVTQPDRRVGRKQILTPTPVKNLALAKNIPVFDELKSESLHIKLKEIDMVLLYAYGELIPQNILQLPRLGFWNIHPSLLPKYRGASPIAYPLLMGEKITGVTLIEMDKQMDHGPIICQQEYEIQLEDTRKDLENKLSHIGYGLFKKSIQLLLDGKLEKKDQNDLDKTFTLLLAKNDGFIPFGIVQKIIRGELLKNDETPPIIRNYFMKNQLPLPQEVGEMYWNLFRGLSPWPGLWTLLPGDKRLKITRMGLKQGAPIITHVQLEGKKEVDFATFQAAYQVL